MTEGGVHLAAANLVLPYKETHTHTLHCHSRSLTAARVSLDGREEGVQNWLPAGTGGTQSSSNSCPRNLLNFPLNEGTLQRGEASD